MAKVSLERQFIGQARLIRLLLWKIGDSTDIDVCLKAALNGEMIDDDDAAFLRKCLDAEEGQRQAAGPVGAAPFPIEVDDELVSRLRRCADKLNRADAA